MKLGIIGVGHLAISLPQGCGQAMCQAAYRCRRPGTGPQTARDGGIALARDSAQIGQRCGAVLVAVQAR